MPNKPRIAFCIFGEPRTMEFCFPSIKTHILDVYHPDVFVCSNEQKDKIIELYHPVSIEINSNEEEEKLMGEHKYRYGKSQPCPNQPAYPKYPQRDLSGMFKAWRCGELLKEYEKIHGKYDIVITTRFDTKYLYVQPISIPDKNTLYIPIVDANQGRADENGVHWKTGYAAHFWYGSSDLARIMFDTYNWTDDYFKESGIWNGEMALKWKCEKEKIIVKYINVDFMLIRGTNEVPCSAGVVWPPLSATNHPEYLVDVPRAKPLRMALCLFGQPRTMSFCAPSIKEHILDIYHPDVFACSDSYEKEIRELYNPVGLEIYSSDDFWNELGERRHRCEGTIAGGFVPIPGWPQPDMLFHIPSILNGMFLAMKCKNMLQKYELTHGVYDVVIVTRFDLKLLHVQRITKPEKNAFYLPYIDAHQWKVNEDGTYWHLGYSAHTWWSSSATAKLLLDMYTWSDEYSKKTEIFCGEKMLKMFCDDNKIKVIYTDVTQMIIKGTNEHPRSSSLAYGQELSATHYPEYLSPPLPKINKIPIPQYTWGGEPTPPPKQYHIHPEKTHKMPRFLRLKEKRKHH